MKNIKDIQYNPKMTALDDGEPVPQKTIILLNETIKQLVGIFPSVLNTADNFQLQGFKQQLIQAFVENEIFNFSQVEGALKHYRSNGGSFAPSVPEFMMACRGDHEGQRKPPEHVWFDPSRALPEHTPEKIQEMGKRGVSMLRQALKRKH